MNRTAIGFIGTCALALGLACALRSYKGVDEAKADASVPNLTIGLLEGFHQANAPFDSSSMTIDCSDSSAVFYFDNGDTDGSNLYENFVVSYKIGSVTHNGGKMIFTLRGGKTLNGQTASTTGYQVCWGSTLTIDKNGATMQSLHEGVHQASPDDVITMKVVTDGSSVKIDATIEYASSSPDAALSATDTSDIITSGTIGCANSGWNTIAFTLKSTESFAIPDPFSLFAVSKPEPADGSDVVIASDEISLNGISNYYDSSVSFPIVSDSQNIGFEFNVKFNTFNGGDSLFAVSIGARKSVSSTPLSCNQGEGYWDSCGYMFVWWNPWGAWSVHGAVGAEEVGDSSYKGGASLTSDYPLVPELNTSYNIKATYSKIGPCAYVRLLVDDVLVSEIVDGESSGHFIPLPDGSSKLAADQTTYVNVYSRRAMNTTITSVPSSETTPFFTTNAKLGQAETSNPSDVISSNQEIASFSTSTIGYPAALPSFALETKLVVSAVGESLSFKSNYVGDFEAFSSEGYEVKILASDTVEIYKAGVLLANAPIEHDRNITRANANFVLSFASELVSEAKGRLLSLSIDDVEIIRFLDSTDPIVDPGWVLIESNGFEGALRQWGSTLPILTYPATPVIVGGENPVFEAGYLDPLAPVASKAFFAVNKTGKGTIGQSSGVFTPIAAGTVDVYAVVDGVETERYEVHVLPKINVKSVLPLAVGGERYLGYEANCDLPAQEDIVVTYELKEPSDVVEFEAATGYVKGLKTGGFFVRVKMVADSFLVYSDYDEIQVEDAFVVFKNPVRNMAVGDTQEFVVTLGNDEVKKTSASIVFIEGADLVETDNWTITAVKPGKVVFKVMVNGISSLTKTIYLVDNTATVMAFDMKTNDTQTLSTVFTSPDYSPTVVYHVIEGVDLVTIKDDVLKSYDKPGFVTIGAYVEAIEVGRVSFEVTTDVVCEGLTQGQMVFVDRQYSLSFRFYEGAEITSVKYEIVQGEATITMDGQKGVLTPKKGGDLSVRAVVNGKASNPVTVHGVSRATIIASDMVINGTQNLATLFEEGSYTPAVTYAVTEGNALIVLEGNKVTAKQTHGPVTIRAYAGDVEVANVRFSVLAPVVIEGLQPDQEIVVGQKTLLSPRINMLGDSHKVEYVILEGDAEIERIPDSYSAFLVVKSEGTVKFKIVVDGIDSETMGIVGKKSATPGSDPAPEKQEGLPVGAVVGISVGATAAVMGGAFAIVLIILRKKKVV